MPKITIKGFNMPKNCNKCRLSSTKVASGNLVLFECYITGKEVDFNYGYEYRPSYCPLIEIDKGE
ncbi:MAG: hypothetical protein LBD46_05310 [Endomicrobium sp.]|jgi:hypothetical protein|nr:hypothetical protein [Endomicrobium sp.]